MVKCKEESCDGELRVTGNHQLKSGVMVRYRKCNKCGMRVKTIEIPKETYERMEKLVMKLQKIVGEYVGGG